ncbi:MAG: hypothetical protein AB8G05_20805 [Oligoflexales bacterium]
MSYKNPKLGTAIQIKSKAGKTEDLANFLGTGAYLVKQTEPNTLQWFAVDEGNGRFRIIDFFATEEGRNQHFAGKVAEALAENAPQIVEGGWDQGVLNNIEHSTVLSALVRKNPTKPSTLATMIKLRAKPGKEEDLAAFLTGGADLVKQGEPQTYLWYALRIDKSTFAIYDVLPDEEARSEHFAGKVAHTLKEKADDLLEGSWEAGVLANITHAKILSCTF